MKLSYCYFVSISALAGATVAQAQSVPAPQPPAAKSAGQGTDSNEIIVTATRRSERLQTVPVSMSAVSEQTVAARGITNAINLAASVPNLAVRPALGGSNAVVLTIRGQVQNDNLATLDPSVGVYVDDVYLARAYSALAEILDPERVEVLRGPQGTLFGRNTIGGAIRVITRKPDVNEGFTGRVSIEGGDYGRRSISGALTIPLIPGTLALRYAGIYRKHDGYTTTWQVKEPYQSSADVVGPIGTNDEDMTSHRISLRFQPSTKTTLDANYYYYRNNTHGAFITNIYGDVAGFDPVAGATNPLLGFTFANSIFRRNDFYSAVAPVSLFARTYTHVASVTLQQKITNDITFKATGSWSKSANHSRNNGSGIATSSFALVEFEPELFQSQHQYTGEAQLYGSSFGGFLDWIGGLYYFNEKAAETSPATTRVFGFINAVSFNGDVDNSSKSAFASASLNLTDKLKLRAGGRYTKDTKAINGFNRTAKDVCVYGPGPGITTSTTPGGPCSLVRKDNFSYFIYDAGVDYKLSSQIFLYAKTGNGYRSGGEQLRAVDAVSSQPFKPDEVINYEIGAKFSNNWLTLNGAAFHVNYKNVQHSVILAPPIVPTTTTVIVNSGDAKVNGFELEGGVRFADYFRVDGSVGYTDFKYKQPNLVTLYTPPWKASVNPTLTVPVGGNKLIARLNYDYSSGFYLSEVPLARNKVGGSNVFSARLSYQMNNGVELSAWARNITKDKYYVSGIVSANIVPGLVGEPRTYGATLTYSF